MTLEEADAKVANGSDRMAAVGRGGFALIVVKSTLLALILLLRLGLPSDSSSLSSLTSLRSAVMSEVEEEEALRLRVRVMLSNLMRITSGAPGILHFGFRTLRPFEAFGSELVDLSDFPEMGVDSEAGGGDGEDDDGDVAIESPVDTSDFGGAGAKGCGC